LHCALSSSSSSESSLVLFRQKLAKHQSTSAGRRGVCTVPADFLILNASKILIRYEALTKCVCVCVETTSYSPISFKRNSPQVMKFFINYNNLMDMFVHNQ